MKTALIAFLMPVPLLLSTSGAFANEAYRKQVCLRYFEGNISTNKIVKKLGLYMPRSIDNGRPFNEREVNNYCRMTIQGD